MERLDRGELLRGACRLGLAASALGPLAASARAAAPPVSALRRDLQGEVVARGQAGYAQAKRLYNARFDAVRPLAIAYCESAEDVAKAIRWATRHGVPLAARSGGHSYGGYSTTRGLVIDVSRLDRIAVSATGAATVGAGARLVDVYAALWRRGRSIPAGSCPSVGVAGLALGGGVGFASRAFGTTCDNVLAVTIVDASGSVRSCTPSENADLYWACRGGGGGNFGIATAFRFRTHPVSTASTFVAHWPWSAAQRVVEAWQTWAPHAPDRLFSVLTLATGGPQIRVSGQLLGRRAELLRLLRPLLDTDPSSVSTTERTYMEAVLYWAGCSGSVEQCHLKPEGSLQRATFTAKSDYVDRPLSPQGISTMLAWLQRRQAEGGSGYLLLDSYGGAVNRVAPQATAFAHRDMLFSLQYGSDWSGAGRRWIQGFWRAMRPHVSGAAYVNYIDPDLADWQHAYYGRNYPRLQAVKKRYDPENRFRFAQSVRLPGR